MNSVVHHDNHSDGNSLDLKQLNFSKTRQKSNQSKAKQITHLVLL